MSWLLALSQGKRVGVYCSDVSGAFDRVEAGRLTAKLVAKGVRAPMANLLESWLSERSAVVIVDGERSDPAPIRDTVYQGTVLGPPLWNCFYEDARRAVNAEGFTETVFADDLNCYKAFASSFSNDTITSELRSCQESLHQWGHANQVLFDPSKESFHILHRQSPAGDSFKLLGITFDTKLLMHEAAHTISAQARWRMRALLRAKRYHSVAGLVRLYKTHVLSYIEHATAAIYHAAPSVLQCIDSIQSIFLHEIGVTKELALDRFNLAPLSSRRDMAMLGLIHRSVLGHGPSQFRSFFQPAGRPSHSHLTRYQARPRHGKQLADPIDGSHTDYLKRSIFGLIGVYNDLPERVVICADVRSFQACLQRDLRTLAVQRSPGWELAYRRT